jgi:hypothetical protein
MKKLVLAVDDLRVESFETSRADGNSRGTVRGHATLAMDTCKNSYCLPCTTEEFGFTCETCRWNWSCDVWTCSVEACP